MQMKGKVVLITGGNSGIGFGTASRMVEEGATVYITGRNQDALDASAAALGPSAFGIKADVTSRTEMNIAMDVIRQRHGRLDVVFANAGGGGFIHLEEITGEQFDDSFAVDVKGVLFTVQAALPLMGEGGCIIINTSITAQMGLPGFSLYAAGKAALRSFTRTWANELRGRGIRVNAVAPGVVPTEAYTQGEMAWSEDYVRDYTIRVAKEIPCNRVGTTADIANAVIYLGSDAGSFVNGIELTVDGGMTQIYQGRNGAE